MTHAIVMADIMIIIILIVIAIVILIKDNMIYKIIKLLRPVFKSNYKLVLFFISVLLMPLITVYFNYKLNFFSQVVIDVLQKKNYNAAISSISIVSIICICFAIFIAVRRYLEEKLSIIAREKLYLYYNKEALDDDKCEMSCQRMDANLAQFPSSLINLLTLFIEMLVSLPTFLIVLYKIGGNFAIFCIICYAIFGNIISKILSKPLMIIVNQKDNVAAQFRRNLIDQAKKKIEHRILPDISSVIKVSNSFNNYSFFLVAFRNIFGYIKSYFPYIFLLNLYFKELITLGEITRSIGAFRYVMQSLAFFTDNRINIAQLHVTVNRINELRK